MLMKIKSYILILIGLSISFAAGSQDLQAGFVEELRQSTAGVESISCRLTQTRAMSVLVKEDVKAGKFYYLRPGNILLSFDDGDYILMTDSHFRMKSGNKKNSMKISSNPMLKELKNLLTACMTGDISMISKGFDMELAEDGGSYSLKLVPEDKRAASRISAIELVFDARDMSLAKLEMVEPTGDFTRYEFTDKVFNKELDPSVFDLK